MGKLLETLDKGESGELRTRPTEPENAVGCYMALPYQGAPHKGKIVEHKINKDGEDILVAEFHTGARDSYTYKDILDALRKEENMQEEAYFTFEEVLDHKPLKEGQSVDKAKAWQVLVRWSRLEEPTWEPLSNLKRDDPMTLAAYAKRKKIDHLPG